MCQLIVMASKLSFWAFILPRYCDIFRTAVVCRHFHPQYTDLVLLLVVCSTTLLTQL